MNIEDEIFKTQAAITETTVAFNAMLQRITDMSRNVALIWHALDRRLEELETAQQKGGG